MTASKKAVQKGSAPKAPATRGDVAKDAAPGGSQSTESPPTDAKAIVTEDGLFELVQPPAAPPNLRPQRLRPGHLRVAWSAPTT